MLKQLLKIAKKNKELDERIADAKGEVEIKGFKNGKLIYQHNGNNVVTNWQRQAILCLMTGSVFSRNGNISIGQDVSSVGSRVSSQSINMPNFNNDPPYHTPTANLDGYLMNDGQFFWDQNEVFQKKYSTSTIQQNIYAWFPTKVLFGTGKEYESWEVLRAENETEYSAWFDQMKALFGNGDDTQASNNFNTNITGIGCNKYSGSLTQNIFSGNANTVRTRTVNDPDSNRILTSTASMNLDYGVVGAIKSPYFDSAIQADQQMLEANISEDGRLLLPQFRGVGRPAFIYFRTPNDGGTNPVESWSSPEGGIDVVLSRDSNKSYIHKITFSIKMPQQTGTDFAGSYYPYNGYSLKSVGLFCDALLTNGVDASSSQNEYPYKNMSHGTMLAKKYITPFTKVSDTSVSLTWSLQI
jgi:hypothetical protein